MGEQLSRRAFLSTTGTLLAGHRFLGAASPASAKPNIVFILSDDVGIDLIGCYGSDGYKTPNIDSLARSGVRFETCHSAPLCGPSRCQLLTGRYPFRTGGLTNQSWNKVNGKGPKPRDEVSVAKVLHQAGYATASAGKWRQVGETPGAWGFDEWLTDPVATGWYWQKSYIKNGQVVELEREAYMPDIAHEFAMDFVRRHREGPFFLYYPTHLVHNPIVPTPDSAERKTDQYADMVTYLDKLVGKVVGELDRLNLRENTVIVFAGDNGTARESGTIGGRQVHGAKGSMMEGGTRVPLIVNWKGTAPQGKVLKDMVDFSDFLPTFADLGGAPAPHGVAIDGRSFAAQIKGAKGVARDWVYVQLANNFYVKNSGWKLNQNGALFDMKDAPFVESPVARDTTDPAAIEARRTLQAALDQLAPSKGKVEGGPNAQAARKQARRLAKKKKAK